MNNKYKNIVISISFVLLLSLVFIFNIFKQDDLISISERRKLAQKPTFTLSNLFNNTYFNQLDSYITDQFIKREEFRFVKAKLDLAIKGNYHDLYLKNDYLIKQEYPLNIDSVNNLINKINYIKNNYLTNNNTYFSIIPDKNYFINDGNLRIDYDYLESYMTNKLNITYIKIFDTLELDNYYKTDSHFKIDKTNKTAKRLLEAMNNDFNSHYTIETVDTFKGVYAGELPIQSKYDNLNIVRNNDIDNAKVYDYITNTYSGVYSKEKLNSNDKYNLYLSGSTPLLKIINNNAKNNRKLILFRDSFGSSLTPLLISSYKEIVLVDTRYISSTLLDTYIDFNDCDILFLYNVSIINNSYTLK